MWPRNSSENFADNNTNIGAPDLETKILKTGVKGIKGVAAAQIYSDYKAYGFSDDAALTGTLVNMSAGTAITAGGAGVGGFFGGVGAPVGGVIAFAGDTVLGISDRAGYKAALEVDAKVEYSKPLQRTYTNADINFYEKYGSWR